MPVPGCRRPRIAAAAKAGSAIATSSSTSTTASQSGRSRIAAMISSQASANVLVSSARALRSSGCMTRENPSPAQRRNRRSDPILQLYAITRSSACGRSA